MLDSRIRLRHLRCFVETARRGSLSAAAQTLNLSQPAASKTIKELEEALNTALFDRSGRRLILTQAGRVFQQHVGSALITLGRAQDLVQGTPAQRQRLAVGVLPTAATDLMPRAAILFQKAEPNCLLRVSTGPNWLLLSQLREGALDLVIGRMGTAKVMEGLSFQPLYAEPIIAAVRPGHPLLTSDTPEQHLTRYPLIVPPSGAVVATQVQGMLTRYGVPVGSQTYETVSLAFGRKLLQTSDAIWFISKGVVGVELEESTLTHLPLTDDAPGAPVGISTRIDGGLSKTQQTLITALERVSAKSS